MLGARHIVRFALAGMTAALLAGCADTSTYLGDPLSNPFKSSSTDPTPTGSTDPNMSVPPASSRHRAVVSRPLPAPQNVATYSAPTHPAPALDGGYVAPHTDRTASIGGHGQGGWSLSGGMPIIAGSGESARVLADRYNVPTDVLVRINGFKTAAQIRPGTRVVIPVYSAALRGAAPAKLAGRPMRTHVAEERSVKARPAVEPKIKVALRKEAPERTVMHWAKGPQPAKKAGVDKPKPSRVASAPVVVEQAPVRTSPPPRSRGVDPTPTASLPPAGSERMVTASSGNPEFRWPVHGRIIGGFRTSGNDGINIAVPEGTAVKAAESGTVAYAGSEIKGFGNLVLIRHPNGFVTAYANNGSLEVHRGEQVKRGQVIAKSGQTGNVASPQLHFEVRKGSTPVDPTRYLAGL
jgi:murein DD-endopeptidase MepM/ murein hydrolase activator NlpD